MPVHDWTRVDAGIFHSFHHAWISEIAPLLNGRLLPSDHYALVERHPVRPVLPSLTLQEDSEDEDNVEPAPETLLGGHGASEVLLGTPRLPPIAETDMAFYRRKQKAIAIRHVSGDRLVAMIEIVSPGNKSARNALRAFVSKAAELLDQQIHLLILDLFPPGKRDPEGIHSEIWQEVAGEEYVPPAGKPLTLAAYESGPTLRAYVVPVAVGEPLSEMPLFLEPQQTVSVPLEATYAAAFAETPRRWRRVLEPGDL